MTKAKLPASSVEVGAESTRLGRFACHTTFDQLPIGIPRSSVLLWTIQTLLAFSCTTIRLRFFFIETCQIMDSLSLVTLPKRFPNHRFASGLSLCFLKCVRVSVSSLALVVSMSSFLSPLSPALPFRCLSPLFVSLLWRPSSVRNLSKLPWFWF